MYKSINALAFLFGQDNNCLVEQNGLVKYFNRYY